MVLGSEGCAALEGVVMDKKGAFARDVRAQADLDRSAMTFSMGWPTDILIQ